MKNYSSEKLEFNTVLSLVSNYSVTTKGRDLVLDTKPAGNIVEASEMLQLTDEFTRLIQRNSNPSYSDVNDINMICVRAEKGGVLSNSEILDVAILLSGSASIRGWYSPLVDSHYADALMFGLYEDRTLERDITYAIISESEMSDDASSELRNIRRQIAHAEDSIRGKLDSIIRSQASYLQDAFVTTRGGRFVVPVRQEYRSSISGMIHDVSSSGNTYFVEPQAVVELNNHIMELRLEEAKEIDRILRVFTQRVTGISDRLKECYRVYIQFDVAMAKARYSLSVRGNMPKLNEDSYVNIINARHPLIDKNKVVPITVRIGRDYNVLVITGPNTGGKTVTLKTVGLFTLMALSGILIPADGGSTLSWFDNILVDIGDEQSIAQNLSTFSSHMSNIAGILKLADSRSLILLDELGGGTDPAEGAALSQAILEKLRLRNCSVIATTHYGEIKIYALQTEGVQNASCEFDLATLSPTYKINIGAPGKSNALLICERLGVDRDILEKARGYLTTENIQFDAVLSELESMKNETAKKDQEIVEIRESVRTELEEARKKRDKILAEADIILENAQRKAINLENDVTVNAYHLLDDIRKIERDKNRDAAEAQKQLRQIINSTKEIKVQSNMRLPDYVGDTPDPSELKVGMELFIVPLKSAGILKSLPNSKKEVDVVAGLVKTRVKCDDLRTINKTASKKKTGSSSGNINTENARTQKTEINVIGKTVEEAIMEVDSYIDSALISHIDTVYIIHGKGTGRLRSAIQQHIKANKYVKSFRLGKYGEGEDGVTVVELDK